MTILLVYFLVGKNKVTINLISYTIRVALFEHLIELHKLFTPTATITYHKMKKISAYLSLFIVALFSLSCSFLVDHLVEPTSDVYVAGYHATADSYTAKYWKNGQEVELMKAPASLTAYLVATSIAVSANNVHVVGVQVGLDSVSKGKYWKNGVLQAFVDSLAPTRLNDIAVLGNDAYMAGYRQFGSISYAGYWKNNKPYFMEKNAQASGIFLSGSDVYLAGSNFDSFHSTARYWKNGVGVTLSDSPYTSSALSIAVSGSDVHVVGYGYLSGQRQVAKYWKNGIEINLTDGSNGALAQDVAVFGNDVYITGWETIKGANVARVWKNGVPIEYSDGSYGSSIAVLNGDVFVSGAGYKNGSVAANYWRNGTYVSLPNGPGNNHTTGIFVTNP